MISHVLRPVAVSASAGREDRGDCARRKSRRAPRFSIDFRGGSGKFHRTEIANDEDLRCLLSTVNAAGLCEAYETSGNAVSGSDVLRCVESLCPDKTYTVFRASAPWPMP